MVAIREPEAVESDCHVHEFACQVEGFEKDQAIVFTDPEYGSYKVLVPSGFASNHPDMAGMKGILAAVDPSIKRARNGTQNGPQPLCVKINKKGVPMKLNIIVKSGVNADGFETVILNDDNVVNRQSYAYGYDCSYDRTFANGQKPYVTDVLQGLVDQYQVDEVSVAAGQNKFADKDMSFRRVQDFKARYCKDLKLPDMGQDFADAVTSIPNDSQEMEQ